MAWAKKKGFRVDFKISFEVLKLVPLKGFDLIKPNPLSLGFLNRSFVSKVLDGLLLFYDYSAVQA